MTSTADTKSAEAVDSPARHHEVAAAQEDKLEQAMRELEERRRQLTGEAPPPE